MDELLASVLANKEPSWEPAWLAVLDLEISKPDFL